MEMKRPKDVAPFLYTRYPIFFLRRDSIQMPYQNESMAATFMPGFVYRP
jgi:hypothetical protein